MMPSKYCTKVEILAISFKSTDLFESSLESVTNICNRIFALKIFNFCHFINENHQQVGGWGTGGPETLTFW